MKKITVIIIGSSILIVIFGICTYFAMDDLGLFNGSYQYSTLAKTSSYIGSGFMAINLWHLWEKFIWLVRQVLVWGLIIFIIAGIGIILGF